MGSAVSGFVFLTFLLFFSESGDISFPKKTKGEAQTRTAAPATDLSTLQHGQEISVQKKVTRKRKESGRNRFKDKLFIVYVWSRELDMLSACSW